MPEHRKDAAWAAIDAYRAANAYINEGLIRADAATWIPSERSRREWMLQFLPRLDHPEQSFEAIHVAGTSGKGSICTMVAEILAAAGVRAGLHISPYLQVATEKLWVDGRLASAGQYVELVDALRPHCEAFRGPTVPMHGVASVALFLDHFRRQQVELGVVEVGVGGERDLTNVLRTRVAAISNVGPDHLKTLGPTLADVARHKAGIIKAGCRAIVHARGDDDPALLAAAERATAVGAPLRVLRRGADYDVLPAGDSHARLAFRGRILHIDALELAVCGDFQAENAALALAICEEAIGDRLDEDAARRGLAVARLAGRLERIAPGPKNACPVLLDAAHNPDKIAALASALDGTEARAHRRARPLHLVFGGLAAKQPGPATRQLVERAQSVTFTEPRVYAKSARPAKEAARELGPDHPAAFCEPDCGAAVEGALERAGEAGLVLVTGSIYLVGQARARWYADEDVLLQRTSWPRI